MVHKLVTFVLELLTSDEDLVVRLHTWDSVRQCILRLTCKITDAAVKNLDLDLVALGRGAPLVFLDEVQDAFNDLEEGVFRVAGHDNQEA